jgi:hypothetical protein
MDWRRQKVIATSGDLMGQPTDDIDVIQADSMTIALRAPILIASFALATLVTGFLSGWILSRHLVLSSEQTVQASVIPEGGDAPESVRQDVLEAVRGFQDGYTRRDVKYLGTFMNQLFPATKECLVLGTEPGEYIRGFERIARFIRNDWQNWGDVRLDVDASVVSGAGDVAWLATPGSVSFQGSPHPIRFTATLVRDDGRWLFRQVQFQWDNRGPLLRELLQPSAVLQLRWR